MEDLIKNYTAALKEAREELPTHVNDRLPRFEFYGDTTHTHTLKLCTTRK